MEWREQTTKSRPDLTGAIGMSGFLLPGWSSTYVKPMEWRRQQRSRAEPSRAATQQAGMACLDSTTKPSSRWCCAFCLVFCVQLGSINRRGNINMDRHIHAMRCTLTRYTTVFEKVDGQEGGPRQIPRCPQPRRKTKKLVERGGVGLGWVRGTSSVFFCYKPTILLLLLERFESC